MSYAVGVAIGRFTLSDREEQAKLGAEVLFVPARHDSEPILPTVLRETWTRNAAANAGQSLSSWLRNDFFEHHRKLYENRPIYLPLSSSKRSFVAFIWIRRWTDSTLNNLLAEHLIPERKAIEGALVDLQQARKSDDKKARADAEKNYSQHKKWLEEL
jgi:hypothetical protein